MVAVIDYEMGNLHSVSKALETVGADVVVTRRSQDFQSADRIVLPGVGSFAQGMQHLKELNIIDTLYEQIIVKKKPFLGICLGMQLIAKLGEEYGNNNGLGWIDAKVVKFDFPSHELKVPHMGWNDVEFIKGSPLFEGLSSPTTFYFVHSYHFVPENQDVVTGLCHYGNKFVASVSNNNIHLVQFHPEKSQDKGLQVLENFLDIS